LRLRFEPLGVHTPRGPLELSLMELRLLVLLLKVRGEPIGREAVSRVLWNEPSHATRNRTDRLAGKLRDALRRSSATRLETIRGYGWRLVSPTSPGVAHE
jgi:DNA-binding response OmpR family regulator